MERKSGIWRQRSYLVRGGLVIIGLLWVRRGDLEVVILVVVRHQLHPVLSLRRQKHDDDDDFTGDWPAANNNIRRSPRGKGMGVMNGWQDNDSAFKFEWSHISALGSPLLQLPFNFFPAPPPLPLLLLGALKSHIKVQTGPGYERGRESA